MSLFINNIYVQEHFFGKPYFSYRTDSKFSTSRKFYNTLF